MRALSIICFIIGIVATLAIIGELIWNELGSDDQVTTINALLILTVAMFMFGMFFDFMGQL